MSVAGAVESCFWTEEDYDQEVYGDENGCDYLVPALSDVSQGLEVDFSKQLRTQLKPWTTNPQIRGW